MSSPYQFRGQTVCTSSTQSFSSHYKNMLHDCVLSLQDCRNVLLIYSVRESGSFQGQYHNSSIPTCTLFPIAVIPTVLGGA